MSPLLRTLLLTTSALVAITAWSAPPPAAQAYEEIQAMRAQARALTDDRKPRTDDDLRAGLAILEQGLARMDTPATSDLAAGNTALRFRRFDLLLDKARLLERLHDRAGAVAAVDQATLLGWMDVGAIYPDLAPVVADPAAAAVRARIAASNHLAAAAPFKTVEGSPLSAAERVAGLSRIWSIARSDFAWFDHVPDLDWDRAYVDALPKVLATRDTLAYYTELQRFVALLHDAHSNVGLPASLNSRVFARPGLRTARVQGQVVVTEVQDAALRKAGVQPGDALLAIDGLPVDVYAARFVAPFQSASTPQYLELLTFDHALLAGDARKPVRLTLGDAHGHRRDLRAARSGWKNVWPPRADEAFVVRADGIAVLRADQFGTDAAPQLLAAHLDELMKARGFVLDLRRNGGGSTDNGLAILSVLSPDPLPTMSYRVRADHALARTRLNDQVSWDRLSVTAADAAPGPRFEGPVAVLVGPATFSAAEDTAAAFKKMNRGLLVGMPTGGSTGQPYLFDLPGGGKARVCVKRDSYPDGSDFVGVGVPPDLRVPPTLASVRDGSDPVLAAAVAALLSKAR